MRAALTQMVIDKLPVPAAKVDHRDTRLKGLVLRAMPSGSKSYYCEYARGIRVWLGRADVLGVSEARESARAILADFYRGIDPIEARKPKAVMPSYGAYLDGDYAMTLRYAHLAPEFKLKAVEVLDLARETAMGGNKVVALVR